MGKMSSKKISEDVLEDLAKYAKKNNFHIIKYADDYFSFHPGAGDMLRSYQSYYPNVRNNNFLKDDDDSYIIVSKFLYLDYHKFLDKREYINRKVSLEWIKGFLTFRSNDAAKDVENKRLEEKKLIERNKSIIEENKRKRVRPEEIPDALKMPRNTPVKGVAGGFKVISSDEIDNAGPLSDDWMPEDWEDHLGGPDW